MLKGRGRSRWTWTDDLVALLAPIYKRYTGADATYSEPHRSKPKPKAQLIPYVGAENSRASTGKAPNRREALGTVGPFPRFVCCVAECCDLRRGVTPAAVNKAIKRLKKGDDRRLEASGRYASIHQTTEEAFGPALRKLGLLTIH
jgi:hypothetical protein